MINERFIHQNIDRILRTNPFPNEQGLIDELFKEQISFRNFAQTVFPHLNNHPLLLDMAPQLITGLRKHFIQDSDGSIGIVRGGSIRTFFSHSQVVDEMIAEAYIKNLPHYLRGTDPYTDEIIDNAFGLKDIDVHIKRTPEARHDDLLIINNFAQTLLKFGFVERQPGIFFNERYRAEIYDETAGTKSTRSFFKITFFEKQTNTALFKLQVGDISTTEEEFQENIRDTVNASTVDQLARGKLSIENNELMLTYNDVPLYLFLRDKFIDKNKKYGGFDDLSVPQLIGGMREVGFASFFTPFWLEYPEIANRPLFQTLIHGWQPPDESTIHDGVTQWIESHHDQLKHREKLILSDAIYPQTINPTMRLTFAYCSGYLRYLPLGKIVDTFSKMFAVLYKMSKADGVDLVKDPLLKIVTAHADSSNGLYGSFDIISALHNSGLLKKEKYPVGMDTAVALADPLRYDEF